MSASNFDPIVFPIGKYTPVGQFNRLQINEWIAEVDQLPTLLAKLSSQFKESFLDSYTNILTITKNSGVLPSNLEQLLVFQNGQELINTQFSVAGSVITIDSSTHYDGSNYVIFFIII